MDPNGDVRKCGFRLNGEKRSDFKEKFRKIQFITLRFYGILNIVNLTALKGIIAMKITFQLAIGRL
jgi:hypothetical protein